MAEKQTNKQRLKEITDSIEANIQELFQSERYMNYLRTMSRFHKCQRQPENVDFRRNGMSFFGGQHSGVYSPYTPLHLPA